MDVRPELGSHVSLLSLNPVVVQLQLHDTSVPAQYVKVELWSNAPTTATNAGVSDEWHAIPATCISIPKLIYVACFVPVAPGLFEYTARYTDTRTDTVVWAGGFRGNSQITVLKKILPHVLPSTPAEVSEFQRHFSSNLFNSAHESTAGFSSSALTQAYFIALLQFVMARCIPCDESVLAALPLLVKDVSWSDHLPNVRRALTWLFNDMYMSSVVLNNLQAASAMFVDDAVEPMLVRRPSVGRVEIDLLDHTGRTVHVSELAASARNHATMLLLALGCAACAPTGEALTASVTTLAECPSFQSVIDIDIKIAQGLKPLPSSPVVLELIVELAAAWCSAMQSYSFLAAAVDRLQVYASPVVRIYLAQLLSGMCHSQPTLSRSRSAGGLSSGSSTQDMGLRVAQALCYACDRYISAALCHFNYCMDVETSAKKGTEGDDHPALLDQPSLSPLIKFMADTIAKLYSTGAGTSAAAHSMLNTLGRCVCRLSLATCPDYKVLIKSVAKLCESCPEIRPGLAYRIVKCWSSQDSEKVIMLLQLLAVMLPPLAALAAATKPPIAHPAISRNSSQIFLTVSTHDVAWKLPSLSSVVQLIAARLSLCAADPHAGVSTCAITVLKSVQNTQSPAVAALRAAAAAIPAAAHHDQSKFPRSVPHVHVHGA